MSVSRSTMMGLYVLLLSKLHLAVLLGAVCGSSSSSDEDNALFVKSH